MSTIINTNVSQWSVTDCLLTTQIIFVIDQISILILGFYVYFCRDSSHFYPTDLESVCDNKAWKEALTLPLWGQSSECV